MWANVAELANYLQLLPFEPHSLHHLYTSIFFWLPLELYKWDYLPFMGPYPTRLHLTTLKINWNSSYLKIHGPNSYVKLNYSPVWTLALQDSSHGFLHNSHLKVIPNCFLQIKICPPKWLHLSGFWLWKLYSHSKFYYIKNFIH